ncbi:protein YceG like [Mesoflavibacter sp. HG96]|uniref:endolytic transglycosylase MltG n=1 Tax=unclassified Mesoflavibacter TaxID=2630131 RepID=UPI000D10F795|nr:MULTISPECIES: endolytic transglycosylase MltG [unclassified Mesoflavibacter]QIJ87816.1 protein YceG like [Mesoflavibacter sp. HG96]QIJ90544.1 protein YceG like [Mesoflavibacter sp. HG37]
MYIKKILTAIALIGLVIAGYFAYFVYNAMFKPNTAFNNDVAYIYVPSNATYQDVREQLEPLLKDIDSFDALAAQKKYTTHIKAGRFSVKKGMSNNDIINSIRSNNLPIKLSFNNQERIEDLAGRVAQQIEPDSLSLLNAMLDSKFLKDKNFTKQTVLNMYVPNTYEFFWNTSPEAFRDRMLKEYYRFWNDSRQAKRKALKLSVNEVLTIASIVQKETAKIDERPRVAGVYLNRIRKGWPLEADPTVIYAKKLHENNFNQVIKRVLYKDLEIDSKYNTYKYPGIPPGPITMPDVSAIDAVLNPEKHDYMFFVADVSNFGYHKFAKTLAQHNANKRLYTQWISRQGINR